MEGLLNIPDRYNLVGEVASLMFACMIWFLMEFTNPRRNRIYYFIHIGMILSVASISTHIAIGWLAANLEVPRRLIQGLMFLYLIMNYLIVSMIFAYLYEININHRNRKSVNIFLMSTFFVYVIGVGGYGAKEKFLRAADGYYDILPFENFHINLGVIWCVVSFVVIMRMRKNIPPFVTKFIISFILVDAAVLTMAKLYLPHLFTGVTYAGMIGLVYILFHSNTYNEVTGAQGFEAMETRIYKDFRLHHDAVIAIVQVSYIRNLYRLEDKDPNYQRIALCFRELERLDRNIRMFVLGADRLGIMIPQKENQEQDSFQTVTAIRNIIRKYASHGDNKDVYRIMCVEEKALNYNIREIYRMVDYLMNEKITNPDESVCYISVAQDYEDYAEYRRVVKALKNIDALRDLSDPRVLCYAQPIIDVKTGQFRTAEALVRLKLDDEIIYPDRFIEAAERENVVHSLTCIMLNKVCRMVKQLEQEGADFDAISINCSSTEFSTAHLHDQLMEIIRSNGVDPKRIRLELTESAVFRQADNVRKNMERLIEEGVYFYLDDFGTGYSNLGRLLSYPFHTVKFDKSLLYNALKDEEISNLLGTMVKVFKDKGMDTLIEGVEDDEQSAYVREHGFDHIQGYRYAKPRPIEELKDYFAGTAKV
jgi:EAL domain-containing protein (putative c-di-GMP-specific phosphodiesterase class I)